MAKSGDKEGTKLELRITLSWIFANVCFNIRILAIMSYFEF